MVQDWADASVELCKHRCKDKEACKHTICCRQHGIRDRARIGAAVAAATAVAVATATATANAAAAATAAATAAAAAAATAAAVAAATAAAAPGTTDPGSQDDGAGGNQDGGGQDQGDANQGDANQGDVNQDDENQDQAPTVETRGTPKTQVEMDREMCTNFETEATFGLATADNIPESFDSIAPEELRNIAHAIEAWQTARNTVFQAKQGVTATEAFTGSLQDDDEFGDELQDRPTFAQYETCENALLHALQTLRDQGNALHAARRADWRARSSGQWLDARIALYNNEITVQANKLATLPEVKAEAGKNWSCGKEEPKVSWDQAGLVRGSCLQSILAGRIFGSSKIVMGSFEIVWSSKTPSSPLLVPRACGRIPTCGQVANGVMRIAYRTRCRQCTIFVARLAPKQ